jgi:hypothetical protein
MSAQGYQEGEHPWFDELQKFVRGDENIFNLLPNSFAPTFIEKLAVQLEQLALAAQERPGLLEGSEAVTGALATMLQALQEGELKGNENIYHMAEAMIPALLNPRLQTTITEHVRRVNEDASGKKRHF